MCKNPHNKETLPSWKPLYAKGFLFPCVPERVIMLTNFAYYIRAQTEKFEEEKGSYKHEKLL